MSSVSTDSGSSPSLEPVRDTRSSSVSSWLSDITPSAPPWELDTIQFERACLEGSSSCLRACVRLTQDCHLRLIHIPLPLYPHFVQAILSLILPESAPKDRADIKNSARVYEDAPVSDSSPSETTTTDFINISVTPVECSIVCSSEATSKFFSHIIESLDPSVRGSVSISKEEFVAIQVDGEGLDAGQVVLDLTSPLAFAKVPIFFISTYFSDYILVPAKSRDAVTRVLQKRGFVFEKYSDSFVSHSRHASSASTITTNPPLTPTITTVSELEQKTFETLRQQNVKPLVDESIKLVSCAARQSSRAINGGNDGALKLGLIRSIVSKPKFFSVTLTDTEPASLLLQQEMIPLFGSEPNALLGNKEDAQIPIILDLRGLPVESTGIVCGVAGRLAGGTKDEHIGGLGGGSVEMSYLSTARAGTVIVGENDLSRAMAALNME
ncbi:ACT domain-containing protein [Pyronema domesticum]|nr:ACT domain-containing protein [Pyronema domesticum]